MSPDCERPLLAKEGFGEVRRMERVPLTSSPRRRRGAFRRRLISVFCLLGAVLLSPGCGRKASPRPPEDILPAAIQDLTATNSAEGIVLSWSRPKTYVDGSRMPDLAGFTIERAEGSDAEATFRPVGTVEVIDRERFQQQSRFRLSDPNTIVGAQYRYRVVSFTTDEYLSAPSNVADVERKSAAEEIDAPLPATQR